MSRVQDELKKTALTQFGCLNYDIYFPIAGRTNLESTYIYLKLLWNKYL